MQIRSVWTRIEDRYSGRGNPVYFRVKNEEDIYPERIKGKRDYYYNPVDEEKASENECKMSKEEADKTARALLQKAGFSDLIQRRAQVLQWEEFETDENGEPINDGVPGERFYDGWCFNYGQGVDGVAFYDFETSWQPVHGDGEEVISEGYSEACDIDVYITDRGVVEVDFGCLLEFMSVTPGVKLLPLDEIKNIMKSEMKQLAEFNITKRKKYTMKFEFLELVYYRVTNPENENQFTYIPAWRLRDHMGYEPPFVVNAMDGSVVDDWDETWKIIKVEEQ